MPVISVTHGQRSDSADREQVRRGGCAEALAFWGSNVQSGKTGAEKKVLLSKTLSDCSDFILLALWGSAIVTDGTVKL